MTKTDLEDLSAFLDQRRIWSQEQEQEQDVY
jgi:hypothetical protein